MSLQAELKGITGNKRHYLLLRIADVDTDMARKLAKVKTNTYNSWCHNPEFVVLHRRVADFTVDYKHEAIRMLRRDNQLDAVLLESMIIKKMKDELDTGVYSIIKTNLARTVYEKLMTDLDSVPAVAVTWEQRLVNIFGGVPQGVTDGTIPEANRLPEGQRPEDVVREVGEEHNVPATEAAP